MNSLRKGKRGERAFRDLLRSFGFVATRGQQYRGGPDSPDVICPALPIHWEAKVGLKHHLGAAFRQADLEKSPNHIPVVASRRDRKEWMVYLRATDFLEIVRRSDLVIPGVALDGDGQRILRNG